MKENYARINYTDIYLRKRSSYRENFIGKIEWVRSYFHVCSNEWVYVPRKYVLRRNESLFSVYRTRWYFRCKSISWNTGPLAWSNTYNITSGDFQFNGSNLIEEWWLKNRGTINLIGFRNILFLLFREKVRFELINNYTFSRQMK